MKHIKSYIAEKLKLDKNIQVDSIIDLDDFIEKYNLKESESGKLDDGFYQSYYVDNDFEILWDVNINNIDAKDIDNTEDEINNLFQIKHYVIHLAKHNGTNQNSDIRVLENGRGSGIVGQIKLYPQELSIIVQNDDSNNIISFLLQAVNYLLDR